jgi:hypothetical protein
MLLCHSLAARFVTLSHELGHLFCGHLVASEDEFWESRPNLDNAARELEAEAVAYLVGLRRRLTPASSKYLSTFLRPATQTRPTSGSTRPSIRGAVLHDIKIASESTG